MIEFPEIQIQGGEDFAGLKVHQLAYSARGGIVYGSFIGAANAVKVLRAAMCMKGEGRFSDCKVNFFETSETSRYVLRQTGLGHGYVHAMLEYRQAGGVFVHSDSDAEWLGELMAATTVPILPAWVPLVRDDIKRRCSEVSLYRHGTDLRVYQVKDVDLEHILITRADAGAIELPECELDIGDFKGLPDYIQAYAQKMVDSAGSALRPLFDPKTEQPALPAFDRRPFAPQSWLIEASQRAMTNGMARHSPRT